MKEKWEETKKIFDLAEKVKVVFEKKDGTERTMICTRSTYLIPEAHHPKGTSTKEQNYEVMPVYDLEKQAWRSFRLDSVVSIEPLI